MTRRRAAIVLALSLAAGCDRAVELEPPIQRTAAAPDPAVVETPRGDVFWLDAPPGGQPLGALLARVAAETETAIELSASVDRAALQKRIELVGRLSIPRDRAFEWLQAVLSFHNLVMVPVGPRDAPRWAVLERSGR